VATATVQLEHIPESRIVYHDDNCFILKNIYLSKERDALVLKYLPIQAPEKWSFLLTTLHRQNVPGNSDE